MLNDELIVDEPDLFMSRNQCANHQVDPQKFSGQA
jgi:hypothetical protein